MTVNKLVRDKIPGIIEKSMGKKPNTAVIPDAEFLDALVDKLGEEYREFLTDRKIEELADIIEVVNAIALEMGITLEELEKIRIQKLAKRGGFTKKLKLVRY